MTTYTKNDFFILFRGWNNKVSCYINGAFKQLKDKDLEKLKDTIIDINGISYKVNIDNIKQL